MMSEKRMMCSYSGLDIHVDVASFLKSLDITSLLKSRPTHFNLPTRWMGEKV